MKEGSVVWGCKQVEKFLGEQRLGAGEATIKRAMNARGLSDYDVDLCLDILVKTDSIKVVRRTKSGIVWGVK
jgi:hypothetical protein